MVYPEGSFLLAVSGTGPNRRFSPAQHNLKHAISSSLQYVLVIVAPRTLALRIFMVGGIPMVDFSGRDHLSLYEQRDAASGFATD